MDASQTAANVTLRLERRLEAAPEKVFAAWTQAEALKHWFAPTAEHATHVDLLEPRVGGRYRIEMRHSGGDVHTVVGSYREFQAPRRLVFTWRWESAPPESESLVTVTIEPEGTGARLVLLHERFADAAERDKHNQGWTGCLDRLPGALARQP